VSLRGHVVEQSARLPDGRTALVRIAVADDGYIRRRDLDTVALELRVDGRLESGELEPTAGALEPFADALPGT
jgi:hypothetical protein